MPKVVALVVFAVFVSSGGRVAYGESSLNTRGYRAYKAGKLERALELFERARNETPRNALAHYNWACTAALLASKDVCAYMGEPYTAQEEILNALAESIRLSPDRARRAKTDSDLDYVRNTVGFLMLTGHELRTDDDLKKVLTQTAWYSAGMGSGESYSGGSISFSSDGTVSFSDIKLPPGTGGTYTVKKQVITIRYRASAGRNEGKTGQFELRFRYDRDGLEAWIELKGQPLFSNAPDDCNA